jgi:drug/metabolite transporter (DMT)-like permease
MTTKHWLLLMAYPLAVSAGQLMFKAAALRLPAGDVSAKAMLSPWLIAAYSLWVLLSLMWLFIIREVPLNRAYPFVALSFVVTPLLAWTVFDERLDIRYGLGITLIVAGVILTQRTALDG